MQKKMIKPKIGDRIKICKVNRVGKVKYVGSRYVEVKINPAWTEMIDLGIDKYEIMPEIKKVKKGRYTR